MLSRSQAIPERLPDCISSAFCGHFWQVFDPFPTEVPGLDNFHRKTAGSAVFLVEANRLLCYILRIVKASPARCLTGIVPMFYGPLDAFFPA